MISGGFRDIRGTLQQGLAVYTGDPTLNVTTTRPPELDLAQAWLRERFSTAGLDPRGVVADLRLVAEHGGNAGYAGLHETGGRRIQIGLEWFDRGPRGHTVAEMQAVLAHEAGHAVDDSLQVVERVARNEAGTIGEHVGDVMSKLATGQFPSREITAHTPRNAAGYLTTFLDDGGVHDNVQFLNDAVDDASRNIADGELASIYHRAIQRTGAKPTIAEFANNTVLSADELFGPRSRQSLALADAWTGVGLPADMREAGTALRKPSVGAWIRDVARAPFNGKMELVMPVAMVGAVLVFGVALAGSEAGRILGGE